MSTVSNTNAVRTATTTPTSTAATRLSNNFDTFLQLLTTQLRNQDPTQPMNANEFTQQLVQYSQVEQQISTNDKLTQLLAGMQANQNTNALGFLGRRVSVNAAEAQPTAAGASWNFDFPANAQYRMRVRDADGNVVHETTQFGVTGATANFSWNGTRNDRQPIGSRPYTLELARIAGSTATDVPVTRTAQVTAVDMSGSEPMLTVGGLQIGSSRVRAVAL